MCSGRDQEQYSSQASIECRQRSAGGSIYLDNHLGIVFESTEHDIVRFLDVLLLRRTERPLGVRAHRFLPLPSACLSRHGERTRVTQDVQSENGRRLQIERPFSGWCTCVMDGNIP